MRDKIAVTGSDGFIGRYICKEIIEENFKIKRLYRFKGNENSDTDHNFDLSKKIAKNILSDVKCIVHCAAKVHSKENNSTDNHASFIDLNNQSTIHLLKAAASNGVEHIIFLSTVAVYGKDYFLYPISESHEPNPVTNYGKSKLLAEESIRKQCQLFNMSFTILRLPLIYGPDAPGNFGLIQSVIKKNIPLPFKYVKNIRTMAYVENVANFIIYIIKHNKCLNKTLIFSDGSNFSTEDLVRIPRQSNGRRELIFYIPKILMKLVLFLIGKKKIYYQLFEDLQFKTSSEIADIGWKPKISPKDALLNSCNN
tara:strand:+ start:1636 stop:2565 length:930 start_codon:yes stop_codon:yes gene_type:complete